MWAILKDPVDGNSVYNSSTVVPATWTEDDFCRVILYKEIGETRVRIWDVMILVPNALFFLFLLVRCNRARHKLRATTSPIFPTFYLLVYINIAISLIRCVTSMLVNAAMPAGDITDKILWVAVRFFLLSTELSVLIFGLAFGHVDSSTSIRRVLLITSVFSFIYSSTQGALEIVAPDENFYISEKDYNIFGHGGTIFWMTSSVLFALVYSTIFILPWTPLRETLALPSKPSFYWYALFLSTLNWTQAVGNGLLYYKITAGLCVVDVTTFMYFTLLTPLVYWTFLSGFFGIAQPSIMFSYKTQVDEVQEDESSSLPHQLSCSSIKTDSDFIYQNNSYDSTRFDVSVAAVNPLYARSLQSPDSVVGYEVSRSSSINSDGVSSYQRRSADT